MLPQTLVKGEALTEAQVPAIYRHRHATLSSRKIARTLGMPFETRPRCPGRRCSPHFPPAVAASGGA